MSADDEMERMLRRIARGRGDVGQPREPQPTLWRISLARDTEGVRLTPDQQALYDVVAPLLLGPRPTVPVEPEPEPEDPDR